ncbi:ATP-binding cassette domain-containing protein [Allopusillimonas soli]|uniref:ATP-binding cassette domain-containing protein n=1 Tax=Allopusillimonas soli TaxID=659016 RepID=A0A853FL38_9BURK|nr:ATP-binding cassette domain-containing protein [Allopusillimonas soli]NYT38616.1 ATP-binding cassette domain-containing protein [Allopusillimonas soli]TEA71672.1 ATP-binding cassette domain-containing protein [Allopusillimonas soli]
MTLLHVRGLARDFDGNRAVDGVGFELDAGEMVALIGPNGAGKSTLFNMLGGQLAATAGSVQFDGHELMGMAPHRIARLGIGHSFQVAATFTSLTVSENLQAALLAHRGRIWSCWRRASSLYRSEALDLLEEVGMRDQAARPCSELAYGDVKRLELAMSLAGAPRLLLMDEPTAGMGAAERDALMKRVKALARERTMAVLFTEHSMDVVFGYADRILVLARGRLIAQGDAAQVRSDPQVRKVYFGTGTTFQDDDTRPALTPAAPSNRTEAEACAPRAATVHSDPQAGAGAGLREEERGATALTPLLAVRGLNAWYGAAHILRDIDLQAERGEVVALMGRNGAGKSTTFKAIMGLIPAREGGIHLLGRNIARCQPHEIARLGLGYVPEDRRIFTELTVVENLLTGRRKPERDAQAGHGATDWAVEDVFALFPHLAALARRRAGALSGGEQQMLTVARTLMGNPRLLLLDEPSEGVAPVIVEQMADMILSLKRRGVSILLSEQNLHFARLVSDRAYVLEKGVIRFQGSMAALAGNQSVRQAYLEL